jgi:hypothetical protein
MENYEAANYVIIQVLSYSCYYEILALFIIGFRTIVHSYTIVFYNFLVKKYMYIS